jgi:DeoR/GlpR family transcriptional regulator of sugar metabolism
MFFRIEKNANEKERAATKAIPYLPYFQSVFIDSSSTALALAERIELKHKTVVTNSLHTALQLTKKPDLNLILLGGTVQFSTNSSIGSWTARQLGEFSLDLMISSCKAVMDGSAYESSMEQKEIKRAAFARCRHHVLVVDHTKFSVPGTYKLNDLKDYDVVVTDAPPPEELNDGSIRFIY